MSSPAAGTKADGLARHEAVARFRRGFAEPFRVLRALLRDAQARRYYLRVTLAQLAVVVAASLLVAVVRMDDKPERPRPPRRPKPPAAAHAAGHDVSPPEPPEAPEPPPLPGANPEHRAGDDPEAIAREVARAIASARGAAPRGEDEDEAEALDDDDAPDEDDDAVESPPPRPPETPGAAPPRTFRERMAAYRRKVALFFASLYGALLIVQWIVIALSRDFGDCVTRDAARLAGGPPENAPAVPRIRLNVPWLKKKLRRRLRGFMLFALGMPCVWLLALATAAAFEPLPERVVTWVLGAANTTLSFVWGAYWLAVFTGASTEVAWREEATAPMPWYVRVWRLAVAHVPGFRWALPRIYNDMLERGSRSVTSPTAAFERRPAELLGLALARALVAIPGVYLFVRPVFPVAAARIHLGALHATPSPKEGADAHTPPLVTPAAGAGSRVAPPFSAASSRAGSPSST